MSEWSNVSVSKTDMLEKASRVQIPLFPPLILLTYQITFGMILSFDSMLQILYNYIILIVANYRRLNMLNIKFRIDPNLMARVIISTSKMPTELANYLWNKYRLSYQILQKDLHSTEIDNNIILELQQQKYFKTCYTEADQNLQRIQHSWTKNKDKINLFLSKVFKKDFTLNVTAIIVSPTLNCGRNIGDNQFIWGHKNGLTNENYDLVYLVHESLHSYFKNDNITHAIIENITDFELAKLLNNSEKGYTGHDYIRNLHIQILPFWNIYLNKSQKRIEKEGIINNITYNLNDFYKYKPQIKNMNIDEFVEFLEKLNLDKLLDIKSSYTIYKKS